LHPKNLTVGIIAPDSSKADKGNRLGGKTVNNKGTTWQVGRIVIGVTGHMVAAAC